MNNLTEKQLEKLTNYKAFKGNFPQAEIYYQPQNKLYYAYAESPKDNDYEHWVQSGNVDYMNGWMYGAVQANQKVLKNEFQMYLENEL